MHLFPIDFWQWSGRLVMYQTFWGKLVGLECKLVQRWKYANTTREYVANYLLVKHAFMPFYQDIRSAMSQNTPIYTTRIMLKKHSYCPCSAFSRDISAFFFCRFLAVVGSLGDLPNVLGKVCRAGMEIGTALEICQHHQGICSKISTREAHFHAI